MIVMVKNVSVSGSCILVLFMNKRREILLSPGIHILNVVAILIIIIIITSWSNVDHDHLIKNLVANGEGLKERLLEV